MLIGIRMRFLRLALCALTVATVRAAPPALDELVKVVASEEQKYANIEYSFEWSYEHVGRPHKDLYEKIDRKVRNLFVGPRWYSRSDWNGGMPGGRQETVKEIRAFDGTATRSLFERAGKAQLGVYRELKESLGPMRPHAIVQYDNFVGARPLSRLIAGGKTDSWEHETQLIREEKFGEFQCLHLQILAWSSPKKLEEGPSRIIDLWLVPSRNHLPLKYTYTFAPTTTPLEHDEVTGFRELSPGLWFPNGFKRTVWGLDTDQVERMLLKCELKVTEVKLNPEVQPVMFADIPMPEGTEVNEYRNGKRIGPPRPNPKKTAPPAS